MSDDPLSPEKIEALSRNLETLKTSTEAGKRSTPATSSAVSKAAVDFFSATAVCSLLGAGVDYFLNTSPWGLILGLLAGTGIGAKLMIQVMSKDS